VSATPFLCVRWRAANGTPGAIRRDARGAGRLWTQVLRGINGFSELKPDSERTGTEVPGIGKRAVSSGSNFLFVGLGGEPQE
jgi:hypothetical protein